MDQLEGDKSELISKMQEVMETLEEMQAEYRKNKEELHQSQSQQEALEEEYRKRIEKYFYIQVNILK